MSDLYTSIPEYEVNKRAMKAVSLALCNNPVIDTR